MAEETDQPLSPSGCLFLLPGSDQVINCIIAGKNPIALDSLKSEIYNSVILKHPRFCSLMLRDRRGRERWRRTAVDVDRHLYILRRRLSDDPSVSDDDAVNDYDAELTFSSPLPADKPLWEIHIVAAHNAAVFRVHHALGDGISLMSMLLSYCRHADDPARTPALGGGAAPLTRRRWSLWAVVKLLWFTLAYVVEFVLRVAWLSDRRSAVSGRSGVELWPRRLATARFRLDDMKTVKRALADSILAMDINRDDYELGLPVIEKAGFANKIDFKEGAALPVLYQMIEEGKYHGSFDFIFVDADKDNYLNYHKRLIDLVKVGGVIGYDNTLWNGSVVAPSDALLWLE